MTQSQVQDILITHLQSTLEGDFSGLGVTFSFERAVKLEGKEKPSVLITPLPGKFNPGTGDNENEWRFLVECSPGVKAGEQANTVAAQDASRTLVSALQEAINADANYIILRDLGLLMSKCEPLAESQHSPEMVNPHVFSCCTY